MHEIVKRPRAREDLKGIWRYSFTEWGEAQADRYLAEIDAGIARLKEHPELGKSRDDLRAGYRSLRINQHVVFYLVTPSVVRIVRVLHVRMDPDSHL
ncbi:type II toxin-antitoxin system RelE/ParE family toxin [Thiocapsa rosea]|uniref:Toxin n=1 Tax=Thiocapsa rosea TaxID=69360 RepID=A0A495ULQ5_9GAMM|nr:type II toxin-antitoxin system RelE/ParE family toxin [Thiocapsa rosea]RKT38009.1 toxin ParE1/3/4 [Thiocapsa rosea]